MHWIDVGTMYVYIQTCDNRVKCIVTHIKRTMKIFALNSILLVNLYKTPNVERNKGATMQQIGDAILQVERWRPHKFCGDVARRNSCRYIIICRVTLWCNTGTRGAERNSAPLYLFSELFREIVYVYALLRAVHVCTRLCAVREFMRIAARSCTVQPWR